MQQDLKLYNEWLNPEIDGCLTIAKYNNPFTKTDQYRGVLCKDLKFPAYLPDFDTEDELIACAQKKAKNIKIQIIDFSQLGLVNYIF